MPETKPVQEPGRQQQISRVERETWARTNVACMDRHLCLERKKALSRHIPHTTTCIIRLHVPAIAMRLLAPA